MKTVDAGWPELSKLLEASEGELAAVAETYPEERTWSYFAALEAIDAPLAEATRTSGRRLVSAGNLAHSPILAVAGKLNAGKTSLVASFLSPAGRARALRGEANHQGTHRFALWLPERWRADPELFGAICARIGDALGAPPEELSTDPGEAHAQYNNRSGVTVQLGVPLLATDPALDDLGLGFLDCPDTDTSETLELGSPEQRLELLRRAAPLCSGFLVVAAHHALRDARLEHVLKTLCEAMPNVERMLAINMVRPRYAPEEVLADLQDLKQRHTLRQVYVAYDYEIPDSRQYRPAGENSDSTGNAREVFPEFFMPVEQHDANLATKVPPERWLRTLPKRLDPTQLFRQLAIDLRHDVGRTTQEGIERLRATSLTRDHEASEMRQRLFQCALHFCAARWNYDQRISELRLLQNPAIANQLIKAFTAAAPWYARVQLKLQQGVKFFAENVTQVTAWLRRGAAQETVERVKQGVRSGSAGKLLTPESLSEALLNQGVTGAHGLPTRDEQDLLQRCAIVIERLEHETSALLDQQALEQAAREVWRNVPPGRKLLSGLTALGGAVAAFGAVLLIPFDGGGTAILAAASVKELLGAAGIAGAAAWWSGQQFQKAVSGATAVQQLSDFVAALCDAFGVPRQGPGMKPLQLPMLGGNQVLPASQLLNKTEKALPLTQFHLQEKFISAVDRWSGKGSKGWFSS